MTLSARDLRVLEESMAKSTATLKDILQSLGITAVVIGGILSLPILFAAFFKYGEWVINLLGLN